jgi:hypothetical protein
MLLVVVEALGACSTGPLNGTVVDGDVVDRSFWFAGFTLAANDHVLLEVLNTPSSDPGSGASWTQFGEAWSGSNPLTVGGDPLYQWSTTAVPVPAGTAARWPSGGLVRTRARVVGSLLTGAVTFDEATWGPCLNDQLSTSTAGVEIALNCAGLGGNMAAMVSTQTSPATLPAAQKPDWLGRKGDHSTSETQAYYNTWGAPATLSAFKSQYGFPGDEVTATYYNDGDLGLGREMHCRFFVQFVFPFSISVGVACYVTNYSGIDNTPAFDVDPGIVLGDAVAKQHAFATVAMVYTQPADVDNSVKFVVYKKDETQSLTAQLDSVGAHVSIPNNCLSCHGISSFYNPQTHQVNGNAKFLPFDPFSFKYAPQPGFSLLEQQEKFRQLNALVELTQPTPAISELIDGLYAPNAVTTPFALASDRYVPEDWRSADVNGTAGSSTYLGIIKPGCRTCHVSATDTTLDFLGPDDWTPTRIQQIRGDVCRKTVGAQRGHAMPQAERVSKRFWASGGRAYLMTGYRASPPDGLEGCDP